MGLLSGLLGGGNSGGGFFGSGGKSNSGNTTTTNTTTNSNFDLANSENANVLSLGNISGDTTIYSTATDHGAIARATELIDDGLSSINSVIDGVMLSNKDTTDMAMAHMSDSNAVVAGIASDSAANSAYLADAMMAETSALASGFGDDVAILADNAMMNNALLVDKTIDTTALLTENHQIAMDNMASSLASAQAQHSADVGMLSSQTIQANNELTSQYMMGLADNSLILQDNLIALAEMSERGLDSALEVAGNVALDDSVEGIQNIFRYLAIAGAVVGVAWAAKGAFK